MPIRDFFNAPNLWEIYAGLIREKKARLCSYVSKRTEKIRFGHEISRVTTGKLREFYC